MDDGDRGRKVNKRRRDEDDRGRKLSIGEGTFAIEGGRRVKEKRQWR